MKLPRVTRKLNKSSINIDSAAAWGGNHEYETCPTQMLIAANTRAIAPKFKIVRIFISISYSDYFRKTLGSLPNSNKASAVLCTPNSAANCAPKVP